MKKITLLLSALCLTVAMPDTIQAQSQFKLVEESVTDVDNTPLPVFPVPSERQLKWNETEFYAFYHYGMNTYTGEAPRWILSVANRDIHTLRVIIIECQRQGHKHTTRLR